jgi:hypothetical protein
LLGVLALTAAALALGGCGKRGELERVPTPTTQVPAPMPATTRPAVPRPPVVPGQPILTSEPFGRAY